MRFAAAAAVLLLVLAVGSGGGSAAPGEARIVVLTLTGCQFLEPELADHGFHPKSSADCVRINSRTVANRIAASRELELTPGRYVFRVSNRDVPYPLGFYLRAASELMIPFKPRVSGMGIQPGTTQVFPVELEEGDYLFSCPLNPTPDYRLTVRRRSF